MATIYHYPGWIRLWHWLNVLLCLLLIITGISMQYSDPETPFINFKVAVRMHNICGVLLSFNYMIFFIGNILTNNSKNYIIKKGIWKKVGKQFRYYTYGIFKKEKPPFPINENRKFNPLQRFAYTLLMYIGVPIIIITGWALLFPEINVDQFLGVSGILITDLLHVIVGFIISIFMIVHIYFCTLGTKIGSLFRGMITGWVESH